MEANKCVFDKFKMTWFCLLNLSVFLALIQAQSNCKTDVLFVLDGSSSVETDFEAMRNLAQDVAGMLNIGPNGQRVAFLEYSSKSRQEKWMRKDFGEIKSNEELRDYIKHIPYLKGLTHTGRALKVVNDMLKNANYDYSFTKDGEQWVTTKVVIVITDGMSSDPMMVEEMAPKINSRTGPKENIHVYCVAVSNTFNMLELLSITGYGERSIVYQPNVVEKTKMLLGPMLASNGCSASTPTDTKTGAEKKNDSD